MIFGGNNLTLYFGVYFAVAYLLIQLTAVHNSRSNVNNDSFIPCWQKRLILTQFFRLKKRV